MTCWRSHVASTKTYLEFLNFIDDGFLTQNVLQPTWENSIVRLVLTEKEELITQLRINGLDLINNVQAE